MFNKTIELMSTTVTQDSIGQQVKAYTYRKIYVKEKSVPQSEFFSAGQREIKPSAVFIIRDGEYEGETMLRYNNVVYSIYRTYKVKNEMIELYAEVRKGDK
jgi:SPP1 family predicted phage head-tail adaptor